MQRPRIPQGERVISPATSAAFNEMMRETVVRGTATMANVSGYHVGGKTGTADKPRRSGAGYYEGKVIASFVGAWPMPDPEYLLVVTLDEPVETSGREPRRTAGWTAVPVAGEIIRRVAPLLGMRPDVAALPRDGVTPVRQ